MPATRTDSNLLAPFTLTNFLTAFKAAMDDAGYSAPFDEFGSNNENIVFEYNFDSTSAKGKAYLKATVAFDSSARTVTISQNFYDSWDTSADTGSNASTTYTSPAFSVDSQIFFTAISHPEVRLVIVMQGASLYHFGLIRPANMPKFWNDNYKNSRLYAFIPEDSNLKSFKGLAAAGTPYNSASNSLMWTMATLQTANDLIGATPLPEMLVSPFLMAPINFGTNGQFSNEIAITASTGMPRLQSISVVNGGTTDKWLLLTNTPDNGFAIKMVP